LINRLNVAFLRGAWNLRLRPHGRCELATAARTGYPGQQGALQLGRALMLQISNVYAVRMAGVFMISLRTIGMRTRMMPRWLVLVSYLLALVQLLVISVNLWVTPVFPAWVLALSAFLLAENRRRAPALPAPVGTGPGKP
jgi:hypothetical protein